MNFIYTLKSFKCNKHCPYCISKILKRRDKEDIQELPRYLQEAREEGKVFDDFVLSANGEPTMYSYDKLKFIVDTVQASGMFRTMRVQTSGMLFFEPQKLRLFDMWLKEITIVSTVHEEDANILKYKRNYFPMLKRNNNIRTNVVVLKDTSSLVHNIRTALEFSSTVALKLLDCNNKWIDENAFPYSHVQDIIKIMDTEFGLSNYNPVAGRYIWTANNKQITMSYGKKCGHDHLLIRTKC